MTAEQIRELGGTVETPRKLPLRTPEEKPSAGEKQIAEALREVVIAVDKSAQSAAESASIIREGMSSLPGPRDPSSYRFLVNRDSNGLIESVDVHPIGH